MSFENAIAVIGWVKYKNPSPQARRGLMTVSHSSVYRYISNVICDIGK
jgi:hypothetical protein